MTKLTWIIISVIINVGVYAQTLKPDSISKLISASTDVNDKAKFYILRSKAWPNSQTEKPLADAQQGLALYQQTKNEQGQVDAYLQLSGIYSRLNKYKLALDFDSISNGLANKIDYKKGIALSLGLMGRNLSQLGNLKSSKEKTTQALQVLKDAGLEEEMPDVYNRLGVIYRRLSDVKQSLYHFDEGIAKAQKFKDEPILAVLYMNKANSLTEAARYDESVKMHLNSIRIKETIKDERGLLQSYNNIAIVYMRTKQFETSLDFYKKANVLANRFKSQTNIGYNSVNMASLYIAMKQKDSVSQLFEQAITSFKETGEKPGLALSYHNFGNFLIEQNQFDKAEEMLTKALSIRKETQSLYDIASTMNVLGSLLTKKGRTKEAEDLLLQSMAMLKSENSVRQKDVYKYLADNYKATGQMEEAYKYQAGYISLTDTLATESEVTNMLRTQSEYEVEKRDAQLALAKKDKEFQTLLVSKKNDQLIYLMVAFGLAILLSAVFYFNLKNKKQHAFVLQQKNTQIETLIRELHHRVKNNLQVVSGLLSLQSNRMENDNARQAMDEGRNRVDAMALIHQKLYMNDELASVDIKDYLENLSTSLAGSLGYSNNQIETFVNLSDATLNIDKAIPIGLIVNELVTNAFKHAFTNISQPLINISLANNLDGTMELKIADNGNGMLENNNTSKSFGMKLVRTLVDQLDGTMDVKFDKGTVFNIQLRA